MQLADTPSLHPFACADGTQDGPIIDTLITRPGPAGRLYLSRRMVRDAAGLLGFVEPDEHERLAAQTNELAARVAELEGEIAELQPVRDALTAAVSRFGDTEADDEPVKPTARKRRSA